MSSEPNERFAASLTEEGRYRLLVEAVTDYAIYMLDAQGFVSSWNPGAQRFKGYVASEIIGKHFSQFYTEIDRAAGVPAKALKTAETEGRFEAEGWRVRKDGTRFWAHVVIDPIRSPAGALIGFAKVTRDLTERHIAEQTLHQSEQLFNMLVKGVTDYAIYMLDPTGHVYNWNLGAQRIKGYAPSEIIGSHFSRFYTDEDRARGEPTRTIETARREGRFESEGWRVRKDGTQFWASVVVDAIRDGDGKLLGFAKVTRDVTEKRQAQHALERTRELLFHSQKMEAIGQLTGGIAHDFNNILMAVLSSLALARKRIATDPKASTLIDNAILAARRGASLTQRMLAFARKQDLRPVAVRIATLIDGMGELLERSLGPTVRIETRFPLGLPPVLADANQLELALLNLAVNARDAMPRGGQIVVVANREQVEKSDPSGLTPGAYVRLEVRDEGEGMDEATLARALEPFFTTKGVGKGTGLGLSMVDGVAAQSGGRFELKSKRGEGTSAMLWLPVASDAVDVAASALPPVASGRVEPLRVLAVDDDNLVLLNTVAMLEDLGHTVVQASSPEAALALLRGDAQIGLLVTDHMMPGMTGAELIGIAQAERPALRVILASGYAELPGQLGGGVKRLAKPFTEEELEAAIGLVVATVPA